MKAKPSKTAASAQQSEIKARNRETLLKQTGLKTQIQGHINPAGQRMQSKCVCRP